MEWTQYSEILIIPFEGKALAIKARVEQLIAAGGLPTFAKTWEPVGSEMDFECSS